MTLLHALIGTVVPHALAAMPDLHSIIDTVGQGLPGAGDFVALSTPGGTGGFNGIMVSVAEKVRPLLGITAILLIAFAGARTALATLSEAIGLRREST